MNDGMSLRSVTGWLVAGCLAMLILSPMAHAGGGAPEPAALFKAGASAQSINPDTPQYVGGYGYLTGPTTEVFSDPATGIVDELQAGAFFVSKGKKALVLISADLTGWFAAYEGQELAPYGVDATREKIAAALRKRGYTVEREDVIISTTHTHGGPAVTGIWGTIDPAYLKKVSDAAIGAALDAEAGAKRSEIWTGVGSARSFVWQNGQGTNHPDGFPVDENIPVLWARDPATGATNGLYATVPNHPDQFQARRYPTPVFSSDWPGYARRKLDQLNGGTAVIAAGTLGRQEPPGSNPLYEEVVPQGEYVANQIQQTMAQAEPLTDGTLDASERPVRFTADNRALIGLIRLFEPPRSFSVDEACIGGYCAIPRSKSEPYLYSSTTPGGDPDVGTSVTSARIGDVVLFTNPGEAFWEVNETIAESISGARSATAIGLGGDFLGYYWVRGQYTTTGTGNQFGSSNFSTYNVGGDLPFENLDAALAGIEEIGFETEPGEIQAQFDSTVPDRVGIQWYPDRVRSADPTVSIYGSAPRSQNTLIQAPATIEWDFGDGTTETKENNIRFEHTFPGPGIYEVTATATGSNGKSRVWADTIEIDPPLAVEASLARRSTGGATLKLDSEGGSGELIGARWTCQDGTEVSGLTPTCKSDRGGTATVTASDGSGNTATSSVEIAPQARATLKKISPSKPVIRKGRAGKVSVTVGNSGQAQAGSVKVCVKPSSKDRKGLKIKPSCKSVGSIEVGKTKTAKFTVKASKKARSKGQVEVTISSGNAGSIDRTQVIKTRR